MWFSEILNPERLKKIKGNREIFRFKADMLIIYNFFFTTGLSVYSERLTGFQDQCLLMLTLSGGVSIWIGDVKIIGATWCQEHTTQNSILTLKNAN